MPAGHLRMPTNQAFLVDTRARHVYDLIVVGCGGVAWFGMVWFDDIWRASVWCGLI